jgi:hypothetical protein
MQESPVAPASTLMPARRASAALTWVLLLLVVGLGSLAQGSLDEGSFATAAGVDHAAATSQRIVCVVNSQQDQASGAGFPYSIAATLPPATSSRGFTAETVDRVFVTALRRCTSVQPRAPPLI